MYRDKTRDFRNEKLTAEQADGIKAAFDSGVAMCFAFDKGYGMAPRITVASQILEGFQDAILAKCDVLIDDSEPKVWQDMILVIKQETDNDSFNKMMDEIILPSGVVSQAIFVGKTNDKGVKKAVKREFANDKPCIVKKANLLVDGCELLLTIRPQSSEHRK